MTVQLFDINGISLGVQDYVTTGTRIQVDNTVEMIEYKIVVNGDTDGDGIIAISDLAKQKFHLLNILPLQNEYLIAGDVTGDSKITMSDLLSIKKQLISGNVLQQADINFYTEILEVETAWLSSMQLSNGAMPMTALKTGIVKVNPYFASFAVLAILEGDASHYPVVMNYMNWHFAHLNTAVTDYNGVDGTIYDYDITVSNGNVVSETIATNEFGIKQYDSSDSYAAMFLAILWSYYSKTGDAAYIRAHYNDIKRILNALYSTMDDGLTWAKPDYRIKYLMDNAEVWRGIDKTILLYEQVLKSSFSDAPAMLIKLKADRTLVASKIEELMWNGTGEFYECAIGETGEVAFNFDWNNFYPSASSQVFMITNGVLDPDSARANLVYDNFNMHYSTGEPGRTWEQISIPDDFYWGELVYAGALMKDEARVKSYMTIYREKMNNHAFPLFNADAGKATLAAAYMIEYLSSK